MDISEAFAAIPRDRFLPASMRHLAGRDEALPIGHGVTNSQPWTVRYMLERLDLQPGHRVLDVGSGSGWTTALLGALVGSAGSVVGVELIPELVDFGRANLAACDLPWCRIEPAVPGVLGRSAEAPFDRILVSAAATALPESLVAQLARPGRLIVPVEAEMWVVDVDAAGAVQAAPTGDLFRFVPLR